MKAEDIAVTVGGSNHPPHDQHLPGTRCLHVLILVEDLGHWEALRPVF